MIVPLMKCTGISPYPKYTYSGTAPRFKHDNSGNWEICFTGDCTITFQRILTTIDVFVVAGGQKGKYGRLGSGTNTAIGGNGGKGGGIANATNVRVWPGETDEIRIGKSGEDSYAFGVSAVSGAGYNGGSGAKITGTTVTNTATAGSDAGSSSYDDCAFGTNDALFWPGYKYGAGGGGGGAKVSDTASPGAAGGGGRTVDNVLLPAGGDGKAGNGEAGTTNSGGGGGGAGFVNGSQYISYEGGKGGSGIVIIRNHRSS